MAFSSQSSSLLNDKLLTSSKRGGTAANRIIPDDGLTFHDFVHQRSTLDVPPRYNHTIPLTDMQQDRPHVEISNCNDLTQEKPHDDHRHTFSIKTYGCQMNVNDSDIVRSLLFSANQQFVEVDDENDADVLLTNTCAIREGAEQKVWTRLHQWRARNNDNTHNSKRVPRKKKIIGVLGCMAERLKDDLLKAGVADLVVGPDAYRDVSNLVSQLFSEYITGV